MPIEPTKLPPIRLLFDLNEWAVCAQETFFRRRVEQASQLATHRQGAKEITVWLEIRGYSDAAAEIDQASTALNEAWWDFEYHCERIEPDAIADPDCRRALELAVEAAGILSGALEDIADEVPEAVWEGFDDV